MIRITRYDMGRPTEPLHPGLALAEEVVRRGLSVTSLAERLGWNRVNMSRTLNGHTGISARLAVALENNGFPSADFWLALQTAYDLWHARKEYAYEKRLREGQRAHGR